jgi:ribosomal protein L37AE/L43A
MAGNSAYILPKWEHRLSKNQIERLYKSVGDGFLDEELINDVGFSLLARCKSILKVCDAVKGRPHCPICDTHVLVKWEKDELLRCPECDWTCPWKAYQKTYKYKHLFVGGLESYVREFVAKLEVTRSLSEQLILIDTLIHRFHWEQTSISGRPGVCSLIEGKMKDTMVFLDHLTYGDRIPDHVHQTREEWRKKWSVNPWSKGRGQ